MNCYRNVFCCVAYCFLSSCMFVPTTAQDAELPNIILCMGDDHGWEETGYYGHPHVQTPTLDAMAKSGLRLDRFYAGHPTCSPTRGSVLTGRHPNRYGTFAPNFSLRPEEITIAHLLNEAGYACAHFGKWHVGPVKAESPTSPGAMGFNEWLSHDNFFELNPSLSRNGGPPEILEGESSEIIVREALDYMLNASKENKPFFVIIWFGSPHEPYSGLAEDLKLYDELPALYSDREVKLTSNQTGEQISRPLGEVLRERYAEITAMDRAIGTLRSTLAAEAIRENTLLWYCGDNGTPPSGVLASPLRGQKAQMYEGGIRVPGIIEWPRRITRNRVSQVNAVTSDMLPTICAVTGQPLPDRPLDGIDLQPLMDGEMTRRPKPIFFWSFDFAMEKQRQLDPYIDPELQRGTTPLVKLMDGIPTRNFVNFHHPNISPEDYSGPRVMLDNNYKLIIGEGDETSRELFHLGQDPAEETNLVEREPEIAQSMERKLKEWQDSVLQSLTEVDYRQ